MSITLNTENSFDYLENFIKNNYIDRSLPPNTELLCDKFQKELSKFTDETFEYFLCHTGYISEFYSHDSSEETLQTKLSEAVVLEWSKRIGFYKSYLPTAKSSKEDVFISDNDNIIVCDVKTFRLGRSQKAPNVKDALKLADIQKWKNDYKKDIRNKIGGLVTFPVEHNWSRGSDFYLYTTDKDSPTAVLFYYHLAFFIKKKMSPQTLISFLTSYDSNFPNRLTKNDNNKDKYLAIMEKNIFANNLSDLPAYKAYALNIRKKYIKNTINNVESYLLKSQSKINKRISAYNIEELKEKCSKVEFFYKNGSLIKQLECIKKFRSK